MYTQAQWSDRVVSRAFLILALTLLLGACAGRVSEPVEPSAPTPPAPAPAEPPAQPETEPSISASAGLLGAASRARHSGDYARAEGLLLRAQRIDPRNAAVYLELARLHRDRGETTDSATVATRGLLYCVSSVCDELKRLAN